MPGAGLKEAPSFSGCARDLLDFFTQFEDLSHSCSLTSSQQCCAVLWYIGSATKQLWISLPEYDNADYDAFKARVLNEYPGAEKGMQFTYRDLERIVLAHTESNISSKTELMEFSCQFRPVATWLSRTISSLSENETNYSGKAFLGTSAMTFCSSYNSRTQRNSITWNILTLKRSSKLDALSLPMIGSMLIGTIQ
ncbi:hypothetical protein SCLCIDRAFT_145982 [Scleroderma citrinum Foug A]|uniref:Uncharacterized protein n=1 Tax=Scleroderma citrinum Foug A TaxID=1036808 RepID=A0A0C3D2B4_9AGAM|nr:hypothetical protein SCLCIDRAFT_145982 [Scleroderma citrinum Foug A]